MGETKNSHFYDFWIFGRVQTFHPKPIIFILGDTRILKKIKGNPWDIFETCGFLLRNLGILGTSKFWQFWKRRAPKKDEDPLNQILEILDMRSISSRKHDMNFANMVRTNNY